MAAVAAVTALLLAVSGGWVSSDAAARTQLQLVSSDPPDGAVLAAAPREVTLTFSEVNGTVSIITVYDPDRVVVSTDNAGLGDLPGTLSVPLTAVTKPGPYTTHYILTAQEGHAIFGTLSFTLAGATQPIPTAAEPATNASAPTPEDRSGPAWPWIVAGLAAVGASGTALVLLKLRVRR